MASPEDLLESALLNAQSAGAIEAAFRAAPGNEK